MELSSYLSRNQNLTTYKYKLSSVLEAGVLAKHQAYIQTSNKNSYYYIDEIVFINSINSNIVTFTPVVKINGSDVTVFNITHSLIYGDGKWKTFLNNVTNDQIDNFYDGCSDIITEFQNVNCERCELLTPVVSDVQLVPRIIIQNGVYLEKDGKYYDELSEKIIAPEMDYPDWC